MKAVLVACLCALMMITVGATSEITEIFDVPADDGKGNPCPVQYPRVFCADCQVGCTGCGVYTGSYAQCVGFCHPNWGWAPNTEVKVTYFPNGPNSSGGCTCSGYTCTPCC